MRNYFDLKIKGGSFAAYYIGAWAVVLVLSLVYYFGFILPAAVDPVLDEAYVGSLLIRLAWMLIVGAISYLVMFYIVKSTVGGLSLAGEEFTGKYDLKEYAKMLLKGLLLCTVTCWIYYPWFITKVVRYFASETSFRGNNLEFRGDGMMLFTYVALLIMLPMFVFVMLAAMAAALLKSIPLMIVFIAALLVCIAVYYALAAKWLMNFAYGDKRIISSVDGWHFGMFVAGQMFLSIITLGFYYPMALLRLWKYYVGSIVLGGTKIEDKFGFSMTPGKNYLTILGQMVLTVITLGIYYPWAYAKIVALLMNQTYVDVIEEPSEPMPY